MGRKLGSSGDKSEGGHRTRLLSIIVTLNAPLLLTFPSLRLFFDYIAERILYINYSLFFLSQFVIFSPYPFSLWFYAKAAK